jgi:hypothetical protein
MIRNGSTRTSVPDTGPPSDPADQNRNRLRATGSVSTSALVNDVSNAVTATPASASRTGDASVLPRLPSTYTTTLAPSAPANANQM